MATTKKAAAAPAPKVRTRKQLSPQAAGNPMPQATLAAAKGPQSGAEAAAEAQANGEDMVAVNIPKAFRLTLDNHQEVAYEAGAQRIPRSHATHWYAEANGVQII